MNWGSRGQIRNSDLNLVDFGLGLVWWANFARFQPSIGREFFLYSMSSNASYFNSQYNTWPKFCWCIRRKQLDWLDKFHRKQANQFKLIQLFHFVPSQPTHSVWNFRQPASQRVDFYGWRQEQAKWVSFTTNKMALHFMNPIHSSASERMSRWAGEILPFY